MARRESTRTVVLWHVAERRALVAYQGGNGGHARVVTEPRISTVHSFLDAGELAGVVREVFGVEPVSIRALHFGVNDSYVIESGDGRRVLRAYRANRWSREQVEQELLLLIAMSEAGLDVTKPLRTVGGDLTTSVLAAEGSRPIALFDYVNGTPLAFTPGDASRLGAACARLHLAARPAVVADRIQYDQAELIDRPLTALSAAFPHRSALLSHLNAHADRWRDALERVVSLGTYVLHGDLQPKNAVASDDDKVTLLDFDECGGGPRAVDLALFMLVCRLDQARSDCDAAFLAGYESVASLAPSERESLETLVSVRAVWAAAWQVSMSRGWGPAAWLGDTWLERHLALAGLLP